MKLPSLKQPNIRTLPDQSDEEKMFLLTQAAHQILGQKWEYFNKIKHAGESGGLFKEKSLFEEMKATQSALKFSSKNTLRQYSLAYLNCLKEIKSFAETDEQFPELPDESESTAVKEMIPTQDAIIIGWTPLKFLLPARPVREKGLASQRHTEGLITKLFFKVTGFYAAPENWDNRKLTFYLDKIGAESPYQAVAQSLEPLKKDLFTFSEEFEPFKFGQASLTKDITSDSDAYDDAMEVETFESQIQTLYWHCFIYRGIESFLLRYYLTMISSTASLHAIRYLSNIFEPALTHAIDMSILFDGSFDTETSKKQFRKPFVAYRKRRDGEPLTRNIKTKKGPFELYNHNLSLLTRFGVPATIAKTHEKDSFWWLFIEKNILGKNRSLLEDELKYTPYPKIKKTIVDTQPQNEALVRDLAKKEEELKELKAEMVSMQQETNTLDKKYREEKPAEIKKQLVGQKNKIETELKESKNKIKELSEEEDGVVKKEQQLAQERDQLLEEEAQLKDKASEFGKAVKAAESDLKKATDQLSALEAENTADKKIEPLKADVEQQSEKLSEASNKHKTVGKKLKGIADKRVNEIMKGFVETQERHTEILKEIDDLDRVLLNLNKQVKQVEEEEIALEERDVRYKDSRKRLVNALKTAEKNEAKDSKTIADTKTRIAENQSEIIAFQEKLQAVREETRLKLENLNSLESRSLVLTHILTLLIVCSRKRKEAWLKVMERFKQRLNADQELAKTRVEEIKKEAEKKQREMAKKATKLKRLKQNAAAEDFEKEIEQYQKGIDQKCQRILKNAKDEALFQKERITKMSQRLSIEQKKSDALPARRFFDLVQQVDGDGTFKKAFIPCLVQHIAEKYDKSLEPLYRQAFGIFRPTLLNRVSLIQALNKSGDSESVQLQLNDEEQKEFEIVIQGVKNLLRQKQPAIFDCKTKIQGITATVDTLLQIKIDNPSLRSILSLKFSPPGNPKEEKLHPAVVAKILHLNLIVNPVPENNLLLEGKENEKNPLNQLNTTSLKKLIDEKAQAPAI